MRILNVLAFDEVIDGTSSTWYTPAELNDTLGAADYLGLQAFAMGVSGTTPTLTIAIEHSANNVNWVALAGTPELNAVSIASNTSYLGATTSPGFGSMRARITLGGTTPQCRLKLFITGRALAA